MADSITVEIGTVEQRGRGMIGHGNSSESGWLIQDGTALPGMLKIDTIAAKREGVSDHTG